MKRLLVVGLVLLLTACAGQPYPNVPVEERGYGGAQSHSAEPVETIPSRTISIGTRPSGTVSTGTTATEITPKAPVIAEPTPPLSPVSSAITTAPLVRSIPKPSASVAPPSSRRYAGPAPALLALMEQAEQYQYQGRPQAALAQLERAQRIAPRDPMVYLQLARLRLDMNDRSRAKQLSRRGLSLAGGDQTLESAFKALLSQLER